MAKKTYDQVTAFPPGFICKKDPYDGEMYWWEPGLPPAGRNFLCGDPTPRWRIYDKANGVWQDYKGTDPVSDDGKILKSGQYITFQSFSGVYKIDFAEDSSIHINADVTFTDNPAIDKHGCQCGVWKSGGIHAGYCDRAGQSDPGEAYL